ncbi:hypothetical protein FNZ56_09200 [Pseudoluteimonas lycopersici]|uniref:Spore coat protein U domain-containing protein n=1 Tax=Pseudoluteimonas lycopersici TaxID=1324796 RepID=A0A516V6A3_9GAMM|nr:hypothetical protein [Lysobacter lycopersici]QDQ74042.1 hypothetical protein FNZ56_09200 [Lysobacter lycopersici]
MRTLTFFAALAIGAWPAFVAHAATIAKTHTQDPATACTLSIPTTDTRVRPKALGFRNEGTTNAFVICGIDNFSNVDGFNWIMLTFKSFDGKGHSFDCTAVSNTASVSSPQFLSETVVIGNPGIPGFFDVSVEDNDYDPEVYDLKHQAQSFTCLLPPGMAIIGVAAGQNDVDGDP